MGRMFDYMRIKIDGIGHVIDSRANCFKSINPTTYGGILHLDLKVAPFDHKKIKVGAVVVVKCYYKGNRRPSAVNRYSVGAISALVTYDDWATDLYIKLYEVKK